LYGKNGQGKTNLLDGIAYLCLTKGFLNNTDNSSICFGEREFEIEAEFLSDINIKSRVQVHYSNETRKKSLVVDGSKVDRLFSHIGMFPIVLLAPQYYSIVNGIPQERRKFIDMIISQSSKSYLSDIMEYRKVLKQRNKILSDQLNHTHEANVAQWDALLIKYGTKVIKRRYQFIQEFIPCFERAYKEITPAQEIPVINYFPCIGVKDMKMKLTMAVETMEEKVVVTMFEQDEIEFKINEHDVRQFASQGQQKTFLVALKIAEYFYLQEKCSEKPLLVLDDLFSELDRERSKSLLTFLKDKCQVFITSTSSDIFDEMLEYEKEDSKFYIKSVG